MGSNSFRVLIIDFTKKKYKKNGIRGGSGKQGRSRPPSALERKAEEIEAVLSQDDVDLWRLRELALTEGGLVNGAFCEEACICALLQLFCNHLQLTHVRMHPHDMQISPPQIPTAKKRGLNWLASTTRGRPLMLLALWMNQFLLR